MKLRHKFGVEIELTVTAAEARELATRVNAAGVECVVEGYNHNRRRHWKVVTDGSCGISGNPGWEFVSPPMRDDKSLKIVCKVINDYERELGRTFITTKCGLHVHHDARTFTAAQGEAVVETYGKIEHHIDRFMTKSRRASNNYFAGSMVGQADRISTDCSMREVANRFPGRYMKVNLQSWLRHGTIEFRQHAGTTDFNKIWNWILFTNGLMERARAGEAIPSATALHFSTMVFWALDGSRSLGRIAHLVADIRAGLRLEVALARHVYDISEGNIRKAFKVVFSEGNWNELAMAQEAQLIEYFTRRAIKFMGRHSGVTVASL